MDFFSEVHSEVNQVQRAQKGGGLAVNTPSPKSALGNFKTNIV